MKSLIELQEEVNIRQYKSEEDRRNYFIFLMIKGIYALLWEKFT